MYKLEKLNYSYDSLEPIIDTHTLGLHYYYHAKDYLDKLNKLLENVHYDFRYLLEELIYHINDFPKIIHEDLLFYLGGVLNHDLYFKSISPKPEMPNINLMKQLKKDFGTYENFKNQLLNKSLKFKGSGYVFLVIDKKKLKIITLSNQESPYFYNMIPLLAIDLWEHAYYINYENRKEDYIKKIISFLNYQNANSFFSEF